MLGQVMSQQVLDFRFWIYPTNKTSVGHEPKIGFSLIGNLKVAVHA